MVQKWLCLKSNLVMFENHYILQVSEVFALDVLTISLVF